jgi:hypothetical protein
MADQTHPADPKQAQDPSFAYERSHPEREAGMGRLDNNPATPANQPERGDRAVPNRQPPRGVNADDVTDERSTGRDPTNPDAREPGGTMYDEEPLGEDQRPGSARDPRDQQYPRTGSRGGTPDTGEPHRAG